jgi:hypothetical protein
MAEASVASAQNYIYEHVSFQVLSEDMNFRSSAPRPGDALPSFELPTADGGVFRTSDVVGRKPILLVTGSYTCPMTASSNPHVKALHDRYGGDVDFVMLHVREAHPGERREQPRDFEEKLQHARALQERDDLPWPIAVDDPQGTVHRSFDEKPNAAYLTDRHGIIVFRSLWAGDARGLAEALDTVAHGERPKHAESRRRLVPMGRGLGMMREMTRQSGPRAERDLWRSAPPMAAMAWLADLYRPLPPGWRAAAAAATMVGAVAAVGIAINSRSRARSR